MIRFNTAPISAALSGAAALSLIAVSPANAQDTRSDGGEEVQTELSKGEARLAKLLEGREAGEPQNCIRSFGQQRLMTIEETAYVYGRGRTIYVQRTTSPESIDRDDVLVVQRNNGSQICRLDVINTIEPISGFFTGVVRFEKFVPYTMVDKASDDAR